MRGLLLPFALVLAGSACADDPLLAPMPDSDAVMLAAATAQFAAAPGAAAAHALIDSLLSHSEQVPLLIVDGIIQQSTLAEIPRTQIIRAELVRATSCVSYGPGRELTVVMVTTRAAARRTAR